MKARQLSRRRLEKALEAHRDEALASGARVVGLIAERDAARQALEACAACTFDVGRIDHEGDRDVVAQFLRYVFGVHEWNGAERSLNDSNSLNAFLDNFRGLGNLPEPYGSRARAGVDRIIALYSIRHLAPLPNAHETADAAGPVLRRIGGLGDDVIAP